MGELVILEQARQRRAATRAFARWERRLGVDPQEATRLADLPDPVLLRLAELDQQATLALYDLVLGVRGWGPGEGFPYLEAQAKVEALDAFLFLADQVRFDLMRRLGWVEGVASEAFPLLELAQRPKDIQASFHPQVPKLSPNHHRYPELSERLRHEPAAVVRSLIPEALLLFRRKLAAQDEEPPGSEHP